MHMVRVSVPTWAPTHAQGQVEFSEAGEHYAAITPAERETLLRRHDHVLAFADAEVAAYVDGMSAPEGENWFPERVRLTGEFYVGRVSYHRLPGVDWCQVCVSARCIGRGPGGPEDYLGLDVWVRYDPGDDRLSVHRNVDSSVI